MAADREKMNRLSPPEREQEASRVLALDLAPRIDSLQERFDELDDLAIEQGSVLYGDDRASRPFQVSHGAWYGLTHAVDNLHALRLLTVRGEGRNLQIVTHPYAIYPLLRAAIENASVPLWLLSPRRRNVRLTRRFRLTLQDARQSDETAALLGHEKTTERDRTARLREVLGERSDVDLSACGRSAGFRVIVREGAEGIGIDPVTAVLVWKVLSGLTHGDPWAGIGWTDREEVTVSDEAGVVTLRTTSSIANVATMTHYAVQLAESALELYDRRRKAIR